MSYKRLFFLVEGNDDERFVSTIIQPLFEANNYNVEIWKYAQEKPGRVEKFLKNINSMDAENICMADIDDSTCIASKKENVIKQFNNINQNQIIIAIKEIESWYLAGIDNKLLKKYKIKPIPSTDDISKEKFNNLIPDRFDSRNDFMIEMLKEFSIEVAKSKNISFRYFAEKYNLGN